MRRKYYFPAIKKEKLTSLSYRGINNIRKYIGTYLEGLWKKSFSSTDTIESVNPDFTSMVFFCLMSKQANSTHVVEKASFWSNKLF